MRAKNEAISELGSVDVRHKPVFATLHASEAKILLEDGAGICWPAVVFRMCHTDLL